MLSLGKRYFSPAGASLFIGSIIITYISGITGLYYYDESVPYHYGWLIYNGYIPFRDIISPLTPLSGWLVALGYLLFGVTYMSSVYLTCLIAAFVSVIFLALVEELGISGKKALFFSFAFTLCNLPSFGTIYYNVISTMLISVFSLILLLRIWKDHPLGSAEDTQLSLWMWSVFALMILNKFHHGIFFGMIGFLFEMTYLPMFSLLPQRKQIVVMGHKLITPGLLFTLALILIRFDFGMFFHCLNIPVTPWSNLVSFFDLLFGYVTSELPQTLLHFPKMSILFLGIFSFVSLYDAYLNAPITSRFFKLGSFMILYLGVMVFQFSVSADGQSGMSLVNSYLVMSVCAVLLTNLPTHSMPGSSKAEIHPKLSVPVLISSIAIFLSVSSFEYARKGLRKAYDESTYQVVTSPLNTELITDGFFKGIWVTATQAKELNLFEKISKNMKDKKIYFGPGFELFYPGSKQLQPRGLPLWSHPGISINEADYGKFAQILKSAGIDLIIVSRARAPLAPYLAGLQLDTDYDHLSLPDFPLYDLFLKKGINPSEVFSN